MKRPGASVNGTGQAPPPGSTLSSLESLYSYLTESKWEDGEPRELSTLMLFVQDGRWKACLNDRACKRVCFVSGATIEEALLSLDEDLRHDEADWRQTRDTNSKKRP